MVYAASPPSPLPPPPCLDEAHDPCRDARLSHGSDDVEGEAVRLEEARVRHEGREACLVQRRPVDAGPQPMHERQAGEAREQRFHGRDGHIGRAEARGRRGDDRADDRLRARELRHPLRLLQPLRVLDVDLPESSSGSSSTQQFTHCPCAPVRSAGDVNPPLRKRIGLAPRSRTPTLLKAPI